MTVKLIGKEFAGLDGLWRAIVEDRGMALDMAGSKANSRGRMTMSIMLLEFRGNNRRQGSLDSYAGGIPGGISWRSRIYIVGVTVGFDSRPSRYDPSVTYDMRIAFQMAHQGSFDRCSHAISDEHSIRMVTN